MNRQRYLEQAKEDLIRIKRYIARESGSHEVALRNTDRLRRHCRELTSRRHAKSEA